MKQILIALSLLFSIYTAHAQSTIEPSITTPNPIFVQGVTGFQNILTVSDAPGNAVAVWFCPIDESGEVLPDSIQATLNGTDWVDTLQMGNLDSSAAGIEAHYYDGNGDLIEASDPYDFTVKPLPAAIHSGWVSVAADSISEAGTAYLTFNINVPDSMQPVDPGIVGIGGKSFGLFANTIMIEESYDLSSGELTTISSAYQYQLNAFGRAVATGQISLDNMTGFDISIDTNFNPVISGHFSAQRELFTFVTTDATLPLPISPASISIGASLNASGGFAADCYVGVDSGNGQFGFIRNPDGARSNISIGAKMKGEVHVTASLVNRHLAGIEASLAATARIGVSYEFQTVPVWQDSFLLGGDLIITGDVKLTGLAGSAKKWWCAHNPFSFGSCQPDNTVLSGVIWPRNNSNNPMSFGGGLPGNLDTLFHALFQNHNPNGRSLQGDSGITFPAPDANPQPAFANRGASVATVWIEADSVASHLLISTLDNNQNKFSLPVGVQSHEIMLADPKLAIAPDGSVIIVWTQSKLQVSDIENNPQFAIDTLLNSFEVWYAVYDPATASIITKSNIDNPSGFAASKPSIAISDSGNAMITWLAEDSGATTTDIWYTVLTEGSGLWYQSTPDMINDLPGNNYSVNVCYTDSINAIAVWITDADADDSSGGNQIIACYFDGTNWGSSVALSDQNDHEQFHDLSMDFNGSNGALAYTNTTYDEDESQINSIKVEFFKNGAFDASNYYEYDDSDKYVNMPRVTISDMEFAAVSYQTADMYEDSTGEVDAGEINLVLKDLNSSNGWQNLNFSRDIAEDTSIYVWDMDVVLGRNNTLYSLSQEKDTVDYALQGGHYTPHMGVLFGDPSLSMVLRGLTIHNDLTVTADATSTLPETPTGIKQITVSEQPFNLLAYPNPFRDKLTIEYTLPVSGQARMEVFDMLGRSVAVPVNQISGVGSYKVSFQAGDLSAGIYVLKLSSNNQSKTCKLVLR